MVALPFIRLGRLIMMKIIWIPSKYGAAPRHPHHDHLFMVDNAISLSIHHDLCHGLIAHHPILLGSILSLLERYFPLIDFENETAHRVIACTLDVDGYNFAHDIFLSLAICVLFLLHEHFCCRHFISLDLRRFRETFEELFENL
jgi:hypothetical protein